MSRTRQAEYKILSFSTTMRNPQRIAEFLKALLPFENHILTHEIIMQIVAYLVENKNLCANLCKQKFQRYCNK